MGVAIYAKFRDGVLPRGTVKCRVDDDGYTLLLHRDGSHTRVARPPRLTDEMMSGHQVAVDGGDNILVGEPDIQRSPLYYIEDIFINRPIRDGSRIDINLMVEVAQPYARILSNSIAIWDKNRPKAVKEKMASKIRFVRFSEEMDFSVVINCRTRDVRRHQPLAGAMRFNVSLVAERGSSDIAASDHEMLESGQMDCRMFLGKNYRTFPEVRVQKAE